MLAVHIGADFLCESQQCWTQRSRCPLCCSAAWIHAWPNAHYSRASPLATHRSHSVCVCVCDPESESRKTLQIHSNLVHIMKMVWMIWEWLFCCRLYGDAVLCMSVHACIKYIYVKLLSSLRSWRGQVSGDSWSDQELLICDFFTVDTVFIYDVTMIIMFAC